MRAANRKSWLPQPSRLPASATSDEHGSRQSIEEEHHSLSTVYQRNVEPDSGLVRRGTISNRHVDPVNQPIADKSALGTTKHARHESGINDAAALKRTLSTRSTTGHAKSGSAGSNGKSNALHRTVSSREVKAPGRIARPTRSGTLSGNTTAVQSRYGVRPTSISTDSRSTAGAQSSHSIVKPSQTRTPGTVAAITVSLARQDDSKTPQSLNYLEVELYQLSLYHEQACDALERWEADARRKLGDHQSQLREMVQEIVVLEQRRAKEVNLDALSRWLPDATDLLNKLQMLSDIYHEAVELTADGSEYTATMLSFQDWVLAAEERLSDTRASNIDRLPEEWHHSHASTALKVRSLQRELALLPVPSQSSLAEFIKGCGALLDAALRELDLMSKLETLLCDMHKTCIEKAIHDSGMQHRLLEPPQQPIISWRTAS